jgi:ureidoglycolate hydrolase
MFILDGRPDLSRVKAFIAKGNMGIVYEANQWHSPMCALDEVGTLPWEI